MHHEGVGGKQYEYQARIKFINKEQDLALLELIATDTQLISGQRCLELERKPPRLGQSVYAFGCPAEYDSSVSKVRDLQIRNPCYIFRMTKKL